MSSVNFSPKNLAEIVYAELQVRSFPSPSVAVLIDLCDRCTLPV
jgi:hypothetical protein